MGGETTSLVPHFPAKQGVQIDNGLVVAYDIYRDGIVYGVAEGNSFYDEDFMPGTSYDYSVVAIDNMANQSAQSPMVTAMTIQ